MYSHNPKSSSGTVNKKNDLFPAVCFVLFVFSLFFACLSFFFLWFIPLIIASICALFFLVLTLIGSCKYKSNESYGYHDDIDDGAGVDFGSDIDGFSD